MHGSRGEPLLQGTDNSLIVGGTGNTAFLQGSLATSSTNITKSLNTTPLFNVNLSAPATYANGKVHSGTESRFFAYTAAGTEADGEMISLDECKH